MDSLTQIVLGAAVGEAVLGKKIGNKALLWGAIAGTIPDLDVFVKPFTDIVTAHELHRGFSHSIIFSLLFSPVLAWCMGFVYKQKEASFKNWTLFYFLCLVTHPMLDAHTTWGTQLFWPMDVKISYRNIFVVDPLYTLPFLLCCIMVLFYKRNSNTRKRINTLGLVLSTSYLMLTFVFKGIVYFKFKDSLEKQEIDYETFTTKPTPLNSILWSANIKTANGFLIGNYSLLDSKDTIDYTFYPNQHELLETIKDQETIKRLIKLTKGWYIAQEIEGKLFLSDLRFGVMDVYPKPSSDFVFKYQLIENEGVLEVVEPEPKTENMKKSLNELFTRIKGN
ncbi:metal-dependent hydrolase [Flavobacteriaceae bacterium]|nr:metal-dependent hydrolase [Flavobacteriaceae bacterium]